MPGLGIATQEFEPQEVNAIAPERGGRLGAVTLGFPLWRAKWELSGNLTRSASDEWRAWMVRLRGSQRSFIAHDRDRLFPRAYPNGFAGMNRAEGGAFDGTAAAWSQSINSDGEAFLTVTQLPAFFSFARGDYAGFRWRSNGAVTGVYDRFTMARIVTPGPSDNVGGISGLQIEPPVPTLVVPETAQLHLNRPGCAMRLVPGASSLGALDRRQKISGGTISAVQDLRP